MPVNAVITKYWTGDCQKNKNFIHRKMSHFDDLKDSFLKVKLSTTNEFSNEFLVKYTDFDKGGYFKIQIHNQLNWIEEKIKIF